MHLRLHWFIPSHGDGRHLSAARNATAGHTARAARRDPDISYLAEVARAADRVGFEGALTPMGLFCEDPWLVAAALAGQTRRLKFMVAFRPGLLSPTLAAQMAMTLQRLSGGRLLLNVVVGGDPDEQHRYGDWLPHDERYARAGEFLEIMRGAWRAEPVDFKGEHYHVTGATVVRPSTPPLVFLGGSSDVSQQVAAAHADVYLAWGEPPDAMRALLDGARAVAGAAGRDDLEFGTRFHVIARDSSAEAWAEAGAILDGLDPSLVERSQRRFQRSESEGQRRTAALHGGRTDNLEVYPNVWLGYGLVRPGAGATLVGSHEEVAERIEEFHALGLTHLILSGQPHVEEAYWFGEGVMPLLRKRGLLPPDGEVTP
jgi:alkanesulfonate monooxygenase